MSKDPGSQGYFEGRKKGDKPKAEPSPVKDNGKRRWWSMGGTDCANAIGSNVDFLQKAQSGRIRQQVINQSLYGNRRLTGAQAQARAKLMSQQSAARGSLMTYNMVQSIVDTGTSLIGESKPRPYFLTSGGNYKQQRKAKRLNKYWDGVAYENKLTDIGPQMFRDCAIDADGLIHVYVKRGRVRLEAVSCMELWVDEEEGQYGRPRTMYRARVVDREELEAEFADKPEAVNAIQKAAVAPTPTTQTISDMVSIVECWKLGYEQDDGSFKGGKYGIALLGGRGFMLEEPSDWPHPFFPFGRMTWCPPPTACGFWGQGLAEQLQGEQIELNKELQLIQRSMHLAGNLLVWLKTGSKVVKEKISNEIGSIITGTERPEFFCPEPIHPVFFENVGRIIERGYRKAGYSEMSSSAKKPPGLDSGAALREFENVESERHKYTQRQYSAAHVSLAEITIALSIEAANLGKLEAVRVPGKQSFDSVDFKEDLKGLKRSEYTLQCFSVSSLPREPAARLQTIQELVQAGAISLRHGMKLLDFPDLDSEMTMLTAQETLIERNLGDIVDEGEYHTPEPTDDLPLSKEMVLQYIQFYRTLDLDEERMDMLRTYSIQVDELMMAALPAAMPAAGGMGAPQAVPTAPPTSQLLPNAPGGMGMAA